MRSQSKVQRKSRSRRKKSQAILETVCRARHRARKQTVKAIPARIQPNPTHQFKLSNTKQSIQKQTKSGGDIRGVTQQVINPVNQQTTLLQY